MSLGSTGQHKSTVTIDARVDSADRRINKLTRRVDKYERALAKADRAQRKTSSTLDRMEAKVSAAAGKVDKLSKVLGAAGLVAAAIGAVQQLDALVESTTQYQNVMRNLPFSVEKAKDATLGLVDSYTLAKAAINASRLGVAKNEEDFARLAEAGAKLSISLGGDAAAGVADLTTALGRGSAAVLDNLGITLKAAEAQSEYAKRLGVSVDALTDAQRAEAFRVIGLERAMLASAKTNVTVDEGARKWNETKMQLAELGREVLPRLLEALDLVFTYYEKLGHAATAYARAIDTVVDEVMRMLELGALYDEHVTTVRGLAGAYEDLGLASELAAMGYEAIAKAQEQAAAKETLLLDERLREARERQQAQALDTQQKVVTAIEREVQLQQAKGLGARQLSKLATDEAEAKAKLLELEGKGAAADDARWKDTVRREREATQRRREATAQAQAARAATFESWIGELERGGELAEANGRRALSLELEVLAVKEQQLRASTPQNEAERIRIADQLAALEHERKLALIEIEAVVRAEAKAARERELQESGGLAVSRLERRAELLGRTAELEGSSWATKERALAAEQEALTAQLDLKRALLELEYGEEVYTNKAALAELEQLDHEQTLARIDATVRKREWAAARDAALRAEQEKRARMWADVIGKTESGVQSVLQGTSRVYDLAAQAQGVSAEKRQQVSMRIGGVEMMIMGAVEAGKAIASYASYNYVEGALHTAASIFNFAQGGLLLSGRVPSGGESASSSSASSAASEPMPRYENRQTTAAASIPDSGPSTVNEAPPAGFGHEQRSAGTTYNINIQALGSVDEDAVTGIARKFGELGHAEGGVI